MPTDKIDEDILMKIVLLVVHPDFVENIDYTEIQSLESEEIRTLHIKDRNPQLNYIIDAVINAFSVDLIYIHPEGLETFIESILRQLIEIKIGIIIPGLLSYTPKMVEVGES